MSITRCFIAQIQAHVDRTEAWQKTLPKVHRPVFKPVPSLYQAATEVDSIWKFALIDSDLPKLHQFTDIVESRLGLTCEWSWHDRWILLNTRGSDGQCGRDHQSPC